jgi:hypothetical protein
VLEAVGSPTRTERIDGKDKWAYRFYTDDDRDSWDYRQATFFNGKVISAGVDTAEIERLKAIRADDQGREDRRKAFASRPADPANGKADAVNGITPAVQKDNVPEPRIPTESDFVDVKGKSGPTDSASDK